jgi:hypothetical protein
VSPYASAIKPSAWAFRWRRPGLAVAALALALQVAVPLFILVDLRAMAAEEAADAIVGRSLCIHDGGTGHAPAHSCDMAVCPLCAALAAASALGTPMPGLLIMPGMTQAVLLAFLPASPAPRDAPAASYRSRAPPLA